MVLTIIKKPLFSYSIDLNSWVFLANTKAIGGYRIEFWVEMWVVFFEQFLESVLGPFVIIITFEINIAAEALYNEISARFGLVSYLIMLTNSTKDKHWPSKP